MGYFLLFLSIFIFGLFFIRGILKYEELMQPPFLTACDLLFFMSPQLFGILQQKPWIEEKLSLFLLVQLLFFIAFVAGYNSKKPFRRRLQQLTFNPKILLLGTVFLALISAWGNYQLRSLPEELFSSQWSGLPVRYLFFANVGNLCIPLAFILFFQYGRFSGLLCAIPPYLNGIINIIFKGRRSPVILFGLLTLLGLWFFRRWKMPRPFLLAAGVLFFLLVFNAGTYRSIMFDDHVVNKADAINEVITFSGTLNEIFQSSENVDAMNAVMVTAAVHKSLELNFGANLWNSLVSRYLPGQLIGRDLKSSFYIPYKSGFDIATREFGYRFKIGSCLPGSADVFAAFHFFGFLVFYFSGRFLRWIWTQANEGVAVAVVAYMILAPLCIRIFGGGYFSVVVNLVYPVIFLFPVLFFAKTSGQRWVKRSSWRWGESSRISFAKKKRRH
ncbi:MAG: hypothetical protein ACI8ZB_004585 [Desulforhopalus sp.]|jgi:hypothetical protein